MLHSVPEIVRTAVAFIVVLGVLVFVHELGHYLAARWRRVHVEVFSIGFGQALATWTDRVGTRWKLAWIPLGGYVKLHGQERAELVSAEDRARWIRGRTFHEKSVLSRATVVAAGPAANFLLAAALFAALFAVEGRPVPIAAPVVGDVVANSAASRAGLQPGDRIDAIEGAPIASFADIQRIVSARPEQRLSLQVHRADGRDEAVEVVTGTREADGKRIGMLGIGGRAEYRPMSLPGAIWGGVEQTWSVAAQTLSGVWQMLTGQRGTEDLGGPLRIAQLSGQVAQLGFANLISFIAILSVNLGLINLFPIPVLDGGHLLFYLAEAVRGRPIPSRAQEYGFRVGLVLLVGLFVFATWNDLTHIGLFRWVAALIG